MLIRRLIRRQNQYVVKDKFQTLRAKIMMVSEEKYQNKCFSSLRVPAYNLPIYLKPNALYELK